MDLTQAIDQYCERLDPSFWAEPFNAWSNAAFIAVGLWLYRRAGRQSRRVGDARTAPAGPGHDGDARTAPLGPGHDRVFAALVVVIGIGSGLFHTFAVRWAMLADVIPIGIALIYYLWVYERRVFGLSPARTSLGLLAFVAACGACGALIPPALFNGSQNYFPCLAVLLLFARLAPRGSARRQLVAASFTFFGALTCRSLDLRLCEVWPLGTHFMWHLLNAATLLLAGGALLAQGASLKTKD